MGLLLAFCLTACHKEEQAVVGVAQTAVNAEHKAQATASERDRQRAQLQQIPLPTKSLYINVHDASAWANPLLTIGPDMLSLRTLPTDNNTATASRTAAHKPAKQEIQIAPDDLATALIAIPAGAWRYGRVVAITEAPASSAKDRAKIRRNEEKTLKQLNDLGIVLQEWSAR